jgi:hypothetical protein
MPMWCHFNGMLIMATCALQLIWMLKILTWAIGYFNFEFWFEQKTFKVEQVLYQTLLVSQGGSWFS